MSAAARTINGIQALRAFAALCVVFTHIQIVGVGDFGVDIFFVVSGFVIAYVGHADAPASFLLKRLFRIVPLYWLGTIGVFMIAVTAPHLLNSTTSDVHDLVKSLLFIPFTKGNGETHPVLFLGWTLNYEMFFYAWFFVSLIVWPREPVIPLSIAILSLVVLGFIFAPRVEPFAFWTSPIMLEFLYGVWLFEAWRRGWRLLWPGRMLLTAFVMLAGVLLLADVASLHGSRAIMFGLPALAIVAVALSCEDRIRWPAWLLVIGDASYSLYLFHPYVVDLVQKLFVHLDFGTLAMALAIPFTVGCAVAVAIVSFRLIERPSNAWLRSVFLRRPVRPRPVVTEAR